MCVKPPRLLAQATSGSGDHVFIREDDPEAKVQQMTCHELTHACTAHLKLPPWLNEGLAMVTLYALGYWRTRYLEETRPGMLREVLARPRPRNWEQVIAAACQANGQPFWPALDAAMAAHFDQLTMP